MSRSTPDYRPGHNIAIKVPPAQFDATVAFYRDTLGLAVLQQGTGTVSFHFGHVRLWVDRCPQLDAAEVWLQVVTDDTDAAARHLARRGVARRDDAETLPPGFDGFWIASPAGTVHLVTGRKDAEPMHA
jgi:catechol 2,3-dioxygenase-like lactoylglutathione lyase family enzyme